ncbi:MAG TPA: hypothetical protein VNU68_07190 [Verrucomicrobiae bacterium]|nr:hypothetical protein [Verrucomicrobiae bacterium]
MTTDALETLGTILGPEAKRDAIHLATCPVEAAHTIRAGEHIGLLPDGTAGVCDKPLGIADPFLEMAVQRGQRFHLVLYPGTVTSLRHVWEHPAFDGPEVAKDGLVINDANVAESQRWLTDMADRLGSGYGELVRRTEMYLSNGDWWRGANEFQGEYTDEEFWKHYETATGQTIPGKKKSNFLSCSC